jgi:GT2 family glycosyltransferase
LEENFPDIRLLKLPVNSGFAGGNNYGLRHALNAGYEAFFLLNVDTIIDEDFIRPCERILQAHQDVGIVGPTVLEATETGFDIVQCEGGRIRPLTLNFDYRRRGQLFVRRDLMVDVGYVLGAAMLIRREVILKIGYLDEDYYPAYLEEADLCYRARRQGMRSVIHCGSAIRHIGEQSSGGRQKSFDRVSVRRFYFGIKHLGPFTFLLASSLVALRVFYWKCRTALSPR